jgi:hypothetical protein
MKPPETPAAATEIAEATVMVVWPTVGATAWGRLVGRLAGIRPAGDRFLLAGKLLAAATIPISLTVFAWQLLPGICRRYRLSSRRVAVQRGLQARDERSIDLDQFDSIAIDVLPGQAWLHAGDLVFQRDGVEVFRLPGVSRPETFRAVCQETRDALLSVRQVMAQQAAPAAGTAPT